MKIGRGGLSGSRGWQGEGSGNEGYLAGYVDVGVYLASENRIDTDCIPYPELLHGEKHHAHHEHGGLYRR